jgi:hypothetical protein
MFAKLNKRKSRLAGLVAAVALAAVAAGTANAAVPVGGGSAGLDLICRVDPAGKYIKLRTYASTTGIQMQTYTTQTINGRTSSAYSNWTTLLPGLREIPFVQVAPFPSGTVTYTMQVRFYRNGQYTGWYGVGASTQIVLFGETWRSGCSM